MRLDELMPYLYDFESSSGVPSAIRTHGLQIRNLMLYPAELWGQLKDFVAEIITKTYLVNIQYQSASKCTLVKRIRNAIKV